MAEVRLFFNNDPRRDMNIMAQICAGLDKHSGFVFESGTMTRRFFFFFYYFPCQLADGTG